MMNTSRSRRVLTHRLLCTTVMTATLFLPRPAAAQSAARALYERTVAREHDARTATPQAPVATLRTIARSYEAFVRRYPSSGYTDNALAQAAGLLQTAYDRSVDAKDRDGEVRYLNWLRTEYPHSPLVKNAEARLARVAPAAAAPTTPAPVVPPPAPVAPPVSGPSVAPTTSASTPIPVTSATPGATPPASDAAAAPPAAFVRSITQTALPKGDRITIELSREVTYSADRVENPDRVFFDFVNASAVPALIDRPSVAGTLVKATRVGRPQKGNTRVVLEVTGKPRYSAFPLYNPFRVVIDVESDALAPPSLLEISAPPVASIGPAPKSPMAKDAPPRLSAAPPPPMPMPAPPAFTSHGDYSLARQLGLGVSRIVIDAGHGGHDPGAQGNGVVEAELVLDVALKLEKLLKDQPGFEVVLTRGNDTFIPLEERTAIANREGADLFLSIHANASRNATAAGVETYVLNFASNPQAEAVAARENASTGQTMGTLPQIVKAIALNNKLAESRELAALVQTSMVRRLSSQSKVARDLGVKQAPFVVLIGAQMPSVLAEISFLTNRNDATLLKQQTYRQRIAQALCDAVLKYQASLKKVTTIASKEEAK